MQRANQTNRSSSSQYGSSDLSDVLGMKIPAVSQHLRKLKDAGIVFTQREGTIIYYQLSTGKKNQINALLNLLFEKTAV